MAFSRKMQSDGCLEAGMQNMMLAGIPVAAWKQFLVKLHNYFKKIAQHSPNLT
jgi:hypothetical protein